MPCSRSTRASTTADILGALEDLADVVVDLKAIPHGRRYEHTLYLEKVRNRPDLQRIARAYVTEHGWRVEDDEEPAGQPAYRHVTESLSPAPGW